LQRLAVEDEREAHTSQVSLALVVSKPEEVPRASPSKHAKASAREVNVVRGYFEVQVPACHAAIMIEPARSRPRPVLTPLRSAATPTDRSARSTISLGVCDIDGSARAVSSESFRSVTALPVGR
jgi:hypothetical protein